MLIFIKNFLVSTDKKFKMPEPVTEKLKYSSIDELMETANIKGKFNLTEKS